MQDKILSFENISIGLRHKRLYHVARASKVSYPVLRRLAERKDENFKMDTLRKISRYIMENTMIPKVASVVDASFEHG